MRPCAALRAVSFHRWTALGPRGAAILGGWQRQPGDEEGSGRGKAGYGTANHQEGHRSSFR